jgi:hypothetical protein
MGITAVSRLYLQSEHGANPRGHRMSSSTHFDDAEMANQPASPGRTHRIGNLLWQQSHYIGASFAVSQGILTLTEDIDDAALITPIEPAPFADRDYFVRLTMRVSASRETAFTYAGFLVHADVGGTAHPPTTGVAVGLMQNPDGGWQFKCKQWTDGDIYGYREGNPRLSGFDPSKWYTVELHVKPRGERDTQFSGRLYLCANQTAPTIADIGNGTPLANGSFDDLWNTETGEFDNSCPPQWNPRLHNIGVFQWYRSGHEFRSVGIAKTREDFALLPANPGDSGDWRFEPCGLFGATLGMCQAAYVHGTADGGGLAIEAFNHSPGWLQKGQDGRMVDCVAENAGARWVRLLSSVNRDTIVRYACSVRAVSVDSTDLYRIVVMDGQEIVRSHEFRGSGINEIAEQTVMFAASSERREITLGLWVEKLHTHGTLVDKGSDMTIRRSNLITHRWDHWDNNSRVTASFYGVEVR